MPGIIRTLRNNRHKPDNNKTGPVKLALFLLSLVATLNGYAQENVEQLAKEKRFKINVESMSPRRGGFRRLTTLYTFTVTPDTVTTELPYAGRAYQAPMGTDDAGIKFLSRDFEYNAKPGKKGAWEIELRLKDAKNYPQINITLQRGGSASIRISPVDREFISYTGTLTEK